MGDLPFSEKKERRGWGGKREGETGSREEMGRKGRNKFVKHTRPRNETKC